MKVAFFFVEEGIKITTTFLICMPSGWVGPIAWGDFVLPNLYKHKYSSRLV